MSDIELRRVERERAVSGGASACCASIAAASVEDATPISAALDLEIETGAMNIDAGRERPAEGSEEVGEIAAEAMGRRREPDRTKSDPLVGDDGLTGCGEDDLGWFVNGGGLMVVAGTMTELRLLGAGIVGPFALPPHRSTRSCTELCRPLLLGLRLLCPFPLSPLPLALPEKKGTFAGALREAPRGGARAKSF